MSTKKDNVLKLKHKLDSDKISPRQLLDIALDDFDEDEPDKAFLIVCDKDGYKYYNSQMSDKDIVFAFESIKMITLASNMGAIEEEE